MIILVLVLAACSSKPHESTVSQPGGRPLFDRIGGMDGIKGLIKDFVEDEVSRDSRINVRFTNVDKPLLEEALAVQVCELTGGPCKYTGKSMKDAHAGMSISDADFVAFVEDLQKSLAKFKVPDAEQRELLRAINKLRDHVIE